MMSTASRDLKQVNALDAQANRLEAAITSVTSALSDVDLVNDPCAALPKVRSEAASLVTDFDHLQALSPQISPYGSSLLADKEALSADVGVLNSALALDPNYQLPGEYARSSQETNTQLALGYAGLGAAAFGETVSAFNYELIGPSTEESVATACQDGY